MDSLPLEVLLKIFEYTSLSEFFKTGYLNKKFNTIVQDNAEYMINQSLKDITLYKLLKDSLKISYPNMLYYLLRYFIKFQLPSFQIMVEQHSIEVELSVPILEYAIIHENVPILQLLFDIGDVYPYRKEINMDKCITHFYHPEIKRIYKSITGNKISNIFEKIFQYSQNLISTDELYDRFPLHVRVDYIIKFAISLDLKDVVVQILNITLMNAQTDDYLIIYEYILNNYEIMDYLIKNMPIFTVEWIKKALIKSFGHNGSYDKKFSPWTASVLLPILKYDMDKNLIVKWNDIIDPVLYFDCVRHIPNHPLIQIIKGNSFKLQPLKIIINLEDIPVPVIVDYLLDPQYKHLTFENNNSDQYLEQLTAIRTTRRSFSFIANFEVRVRFALNSYELFNFLQGGPTIEFPVENYIEIPFFNSLKPIDSNPELIDKKHWQKLVGLWEYMPEFFLNWIIGSNDIDCYIYFHDHIISYYEDLVSRGYIYVPSPFRSRKLELLYLTDHGNQIKKFLQNGINIDVLIARGIFVPELGDDITFYEDDIYQIQKEIIKNLLKMSDTNLESYWWIAYLSPDLRQVLEEFVL